MDVSTRRRRPLVSRTRIQREARALQKLSLPAFD